ncbi:MAG: hypothetical protein K2X53_02545, partial [Alphaproteobacteria bacterium]|nr:hypothetical protein [Alphaproteobacteria bacterium]
PSTPLIFSTFLLLALLIAGYFQSRSFVENLLGGGRLRDIMLSPTPFEWILFILMSLEIALIIFAFCLNITALYFFDILTYDAFLSLLSATPFAVIGVVSVSHMIASLLSLSNHSSYMGIILAAPLQLPLVIFYLGFMENTDSSSFVFLAAIAFFLLPLSLLVVPRILFRCL